MQLLLGINKRFYLSMLFKRHLILAKRSARQCAVFCFVLLVIVIIVFFSGGNIMVVCVLGDEPEGFHVRSTSKRGTVYMTLFTMRLRCAGRVFTRVLLSCLLAVQVAFWRCYWLWTTLPSTLCCNNRRVLSCALRESGR